MSTPTPKLKRIEIVSFGYKFGAPPPANLVFDVRFIENPFWHEELRPLTGRDALVQEFLMAQPETVEFLADLERQVRRALAGYLKNGNNHEVVRIAIGCTGGRHRSQFLAIKCFLIASQAAHALELDGSQVVLIHRDRGRDEHGAGSELRERGLAVLFSPAMVDGNLVRLEVAPDAIADVRVRQAVS